MSDTHPQTIQKPITKRRLHKTKKFLGFSLHAFWELSIVLILVVVGALALFLYKLSHNELDLGFVKERIERAINGEIAPYYIETRFLGLEWRNIFDRPHFKIDDIYFLNPQGEKLLTLEELGFSLSRTQLLAGVVLPHDITLKGLDLHFVRQENGSVQLGFVAGPSYILYSGVENDTETFNFNTLHEFYQDNAQDLFEQGFFRRLKTLEISNSSIVFEDLQKDFAISFPDVAAKLTSEYRALDLLLQNKGSENDLLQVEARYNRRYQELELTTKTRQFNPFLWSALFDKETINPENSYALIDSDIAASFDDYMNLQSAEMKVQTKDSRIALPTLYDAPFPVQELSLNGFFNRQALTIDIRDSLLKAYDLPILLQANIPVFSKSVSSYHIPLQLNLEKFSVPIAEAAFPDAHQEKPIYKWLTQRLQKGQINDFKMDVDLSLAQQDDNEWGAHMDQLVSDFSFENLRVDYLTPMHPLSDVSGHVSLDSIPDKMMISADSGKIDDLSLSSIQIGIRDLFADKKSTVDLDFMASGKLRDFFDYLKPKPVMIEDKIDFDPDAVDGAGDLHVKMTIPTREDVPLEEIGMDITGNLKQILIPKLVKDLDVSADDVEFTIKDGLMAAKGSGRLAGRDADFYWQQYMKSAGKPFKMKVDANIKADVNLRQHFGVDIDDFISGTSHVNLSYVSYPDTKADVSAKIDLTPSILHIDPLGYKKGSGERATATVRAQLLDNQIQAVDNLSILAPDLNIQNGSLQFNKGALQTLKFPQNKIEANDVRLEIQYTSSHEMTMKITGDTLDVRSLLKTPQDKSDDGPHMICHVDVMRLLTNDKYGVSPAKIYLIQERNGDISQFEMDGRTGNGEVYVRYKPGPDGNPSLRAEMDDAGAALRAFGLYQTVEGGHLTVTGTSSDRVWKGNVSGVFLMQNFSVRKAPVLAKLISAMSLPGLGRLLGDDGLVFKKMRADFSWTARPEGALINIKDGRTSGSELGLTFEGIIDRATNTLNLEGTIVPVSTINNLIGDIPLIGAVITGGTGALIAATYKIKGSFEDAKVSINPLSALAPGIIRKILFED